MGRRDERGFARAGMPGGGAAYNRLPHRRGRAVAGLLSSPRRGFRCVFLLNLGIAVPVTVGNLGIFEASLAFGLSRVGIPAEDSLAIATLEHFVKFGGLLFCLGLLRLAKLAGTVASRTRSPTDSLK